MARPSTYTEELAYKICEELARGRSLVSICDSMKIGYTTVKQWLAAHEEFATNYARAREEQADFHADEIITIADTDEDPARARVRIDARKWIAGKMRPKVYGDKTTLSGDPDAPLSITVVTGIPRQPNE